MKNKMMRIASILLVATLLTTCAISGTFAKYVTKASGEDTARVAKWGIVLGIKGAEAFGTQYAAEDEAYLAAEGEYSVVSSNEDKVVAPGTSSELLGTTLVATVKGAPEVAARYSISGSVSDIVLKAGTYTDYTNLVLKDGKYGYTDTFTLEEDYAPVKWNLVIAGKGQTIDLAETLYAELPDNLIAAAESYGLTEDGCSFISAVNILKKVADNDTYTQVVEAALGSIVSGGRNFQLDVTDDGVFTLSYDFDPNKEMDYTFTLGWEWAFEQVVAADANAGLTADEAAQLALYDAADTFLGNWAAVELGQTIEGFEAPTDDISSIELGATLTATAVQID